MLEVHLLHEEDFMKTVKFGIIGCGLMGKEFAGVAGRWCHLNEECAAPEIIAVCDANPAAMANVADVELPYSSSCAA